MSAPSKEGMASSSSLSTVKHSSDGVTQAIFVPFGMKIEFSLQLKIGTTVSSSRKHSTVDTSRLPMTAQGDSTAESFSSFNLLVTTVETPIRNVNVSVFQEVSERYFAKKSLPRSIGTSPGLPCLVVHRGYQCNRHANSMYFLVLQEYRENV
ncbi:tRNA pseudouridine synthase A [Frankliniella fusca]|uniref:tRNA pseudouridine synthase A n=1 Tax=Frankliniella fusca TaxID=407009 RepID=A0AAE1HGT3_9NEOP|nr:tRNA pseudouridine synthase A [Frankliniella fusca]KAK3926648.1 tRNA pseudouridine synthase A [Frankliniella fusca]